MSKGEREDLKRLARERARVAKADAARRTADLKAMFEQQIVTFYDYNRDDVWKDAHRAAEDAVRDAQEKIAARCVELGIPAEMAPQLSFAWHGRGPAAVAFRQQELRRAAYKRIDAMERTAKHEIDRKALDIQTDLVRAGLTSGEAVEFLSAMPTAEALMPDIDIAELEPPPALGMGDDLF
jgi:hypothetical protein